MKIVQACRYYVSNYIDNMYFMLLINNIHIYFSVNVHVCIYMYTLYYMHIVDTYMTAVCVNVYMIMFNVYIMALVCFDEFAKAETVITDRLQIVLTLITDSCY